MGLLAAITALAFCALHIVVPVLPMLVGLFDDSASRVQLVLSASISLELPRGSSSTVRCRTTSADVRF